MVLRVHPSARDIVQAAVSGDGQGAVVKNGRAAGKACRHGHRAAAVDNLGRWRGQGSCGARMQCNAHVREEMKSVSLREARTADMSTNGCLGLGPGSPAHAAMRAARARTVSGMGGGWQGRAGCSCSQCEGLQPPCLTQVHAQRKGVLQGLRNAMDAQAAAPSQRLLKACSRQQTAQATQS